MWERNCISSHRVSVGSYKMTELKTQTLIRASFSLLSCTDMSNHDLLWGGDRCLTQGGHGRWTSLQLPLRQGRKIQRGSISSVAQHKLLKNNNGNANQRRTFWFSADKKAPMVPVVETQFLKMIPVLKMNNKTCEKKWVKTAHISTNICICSYCLRLLGAVVVVVQSGWGGWMEYCV